MADARSLLRQQRAARQQAQKPQKQSAVPAAVPVSKKRKTADDSAEERKRTRTEEEAGVPAGFFDAGAAQDDEGVSTIAQRSSQIPGVPPPSTSAVPALDAAAEAELDAFMDEMKREKPARPQPTIHAGAVIEAAPMTAAEIAAQAREELSAQRAKRDDEMEGEKEDAARALEEEFDEMEDLEERVKKLRDQREALRSRVAHPAEVENVPQRAPQVEDDEDGSEDEDWDDWRFRPA